MNVWIAIAVTKQGSPTARAFDSREKAEIFAFEISQQIAALDIYYVKTELNAGA